MKKLLSKSQANLDIPPPAGYLPRCLARHRLLTRLMQVMLPSVLTASCLLPHLAQAKVATPEAVAPQAINASPGDVVQSTARPEIKFSIGPSGIYYLYREFRTSTSDAVPYMDIRGWMGGFESNLQINFNPKGVGVLIVPFDLAVYGGRRMRYTGQDSDTGNVDRPPVPAVYGSLTTNIENMFLFWTRSLIGPSIPFLEHYRINLLSGVGYKYTVNRTPDASQDYRTNDLVYLPLVLQFEYSKGIFSVLTHVEYDVFLSGWQTSFHRARTVRFDNPAAYEYQAHHAIMKQLGGHGARAFVQFNIANFLITPFVNYFLVKESEDGNYLLVGQTTGHVYNDMGIANEPLNISIEGGVRFGYQF